DVLLPFFRNDLANLDRIVLDDVLEDLYDRGVDVVVLRDRFAELGGWREHRPHEISALELDVLERLGIQRVGQRHADRASVLELDRNGGVFLGEVLAQEPDDLLVDRDALQLDDRKPELLVKDAADVPLADHALPRQDLTQRLFGLSLPPQRFPELLVGDEPRLEQVLPQLLP